MKYLIHRATPTRQERCPTRRWQFLFGLSLLVAFELALDPSARANTPVVVVPGSSDLGLPSSYSPPPLPNPTNDVEFSSTPYLPSSFIISGTSVLTYGTLNDFSSTPLTVDLSSTGIQLNGGSNSLSPLSTSDLIYISPGSNLDMTSTGSGILLVTSPGNFDTDAGSTLLFTPSTTIAVLSTALTFTGTGSDTIDGGIVLQGGSLIFGHGGSGSVLNNASITSDNGYLGMNGTSQTASMLNLIASSMTKVVFGPGVGPAAGGQLTLTDPLGILGAGTLLIANWVGSSITGGGGGLGSTEVYVASPSAVPAAILANTLWNNVTVNSVFYSTFVGAQIINDGTYWEVVPNIPAPEPATIFVSLALLGLLGWNGRRRIFEKWRVVFQAPGSA